MEAKTSADPINVVLSYHRYDLKWRDYFIKRLTPFKEKGVLYIVDDEITDEKQAIHPTLQRYLTSVDIIILLISTKYLSLKMVIEEEIPNKILPLQNHQTRIIPVYIENCSWQSIDWLREMKLWPTHQLPFSNMSEEESEKYASKLIQEILSPMIQLSGDNAGAHASTYTDFPAGSGEISINNKLDQVQHERFQKSFIEFLIHSRGWPKDDIDIKKGIFITLNAVSLYIRDTKSRKVVINATLSYYKSDIILKAICQYMNGVLRLSAPDYIKGYIVFPAPPNSREPFEIYNVPLEGEAFRIKLREFPYYEEQMKKDDEIIRKKDENILTSDLKEENRHDIIRKQFLEFLKKQGWQENAIKTEVKSKESSAAADVILCDPSSQIELSIIEIKSSNDQRVIQEAIRQIQKYNSLINKKLLSYIVAPIQSVNSGDKNQCDNYEILECGENEETNRVLREDFPTYNQMRFTYSLSNAGKRLCQSLVELAKNIHGYSINAPCEDYINLQIKLNNRTAAQIHRVNDSDDNIALVLAGYQKAFPEPIAKSYILRGEINHLSGNINKHQKEVAWLEGKINHKRLRFKAGVYIIKPGSLVLDEVENEVGELLKLALQNAEKSSGSNREQKQTSSDVVHSHIADQATKDDKLGFEYYVEGITEFLTSEQTEAPLTLSIEGPWGSGKSSFMMMLQERLTKKGKPTVWFNAWRHDKAEAMCATFALVFIGQMNKGMITSLLGGIWFAITFQYAKSKQYWIDFYRSLRGQFKLFWLRFNWSDGWFDVLRWMGMWLVFLVSIVAGGILGWKGGYGLFDKLLENWQGAAAKITETLTCKELFQIIGGTGGIAGVITVLFTIIHKLKDWIGNPLEVNLKKYVSYPDYEGNVQFVEKFHNDFEKIVRAYSGKQKVYVFIDDIDRCMVPKSADLMQAMNMLICNSPNLIFIVGMDREKVAAGLAVKFEKLLPYLSSISVETDKDDKYIVPPKEAKKFGYDFIEKFIQLPFTLPKPDKTMIRDYVRQLCGYSKPVEKVSQVVKTTPKIYIPTVEPDFGPLNPLKDQNIIVKDTLEENKDDSDLKNVDINNGSNNIEKRKEIRERVDDHELLCRVGEIVTKALEYNPRRIKQFINLYRLRTYLAAGRNLIELDGESFNSTDWTLERLAKFVAIELRWPMFLADVMKDRALLTRMQGYALGDSPDKPERWADDKSLLEFLKATLEKEESINLWDLSDVDIENLMKVSGAVSKTPNTGTNPE